jgi:hypothetical protein
MVSRVLTLDFTGIMGLNSVSKKSGEIYFSEPSRLQPEINFVRGRKLHH